MSRARHLHHTHADYLGVERDSPTKHEYAHGEIFAMAGGTPEHGALAARAIVLLARLFPACTILSSDVRVRVSASDLTTYPDASVVCGPLARAAEDALAITNPRVLVEVTSPFTEDYDRGQKLSNYRQLPSLEALLILSHREARITLHLRTAAGWRSSEHRGGEHLQLSGATLSVDEVYSALAPLSGS